jgi:Flp pilus assembly pilin Flp
MCTAPERQADEASMASRCERPVRAPIVAAVHRFAAERRGVTSIEYALLGVFITVAIAGSVAGFTGGLGSLMANSFAKIASAM